MQTLFIESNTIAFIVFTLTKRYEKVEGFRGIYNEKRA